MIRVLVCGGRDYEKRREVDAFLDSVHRARGIGLIIHGCARGADSLASLWSRTRRIQEARFRADWATNGKRAGPMRNQRMLDEGKPELVIAFPGGKGTADMVRRARAAGVEVVEVLSDPVASGTPEAGKAVENPEAEK